MLCDVWQGKIIMEHELKKKIRWNDIDTGTVLWGDEEEIAAEKLVKKSTDTQKRYKIIKYKCEKCGYEWPTASQKIQLYCLKCNHEVPNEVLVDLRGH